MLAKLKKIGKEKNLASLISNLSVAFTGLLSFMMLTRQLEKEQFGDWVLFITIATFVDLLRFGLTRTAAVRELSGIDVKGKKVILASTFRINLVLLLLIAMVCWLLLLLKNLSGVQINNGYHLFLIWYPLLGLSNLSWNNAMSLFQAEQSFHLMMRVRLSNVGLFLIFLVLNHWFFGLDLVFIIIANITVNFVSSIWCMLKKWDGLFYLKNAERKTEKELINYGKYSMGTLISSSLLKSADTIIIGLSPFLGSTGIAMYAIPLKLTDLVSIPLNSFSMTAFPRMSKKSIEGDLDGVRKIFYTYSGAVTFLFLPVAILGYVFADYLVLFLGGDEYLDSLPLLTTVFRVFTLYLLLLPIDRFTGVLLNSLNRPKYNFNKTIVMIVSNVLVDLIAVFIFKSLVAVAVGTVLFTLLGVFLGFYFVQKEMEIKVKDIFHESFLFFRNIKMHMAK